MAKLNKRKKVVGIALSGTVGGIVAALADVVQKGEASAIGKIEKAIETGLLEGSNIPQYSVELEMSLQAYREGDEEEEPLVISLKSTWIPLFLQRLFK